MSESTKPDYWGNPEAAYKAGESAGRALAIREAAEQCYTKGEHATWKSGEACHRAILALLSTTHVDAQAAHDSQIRKELRNYVEQLNDISDSLYTTNALRGGQIRNIGRHIKELADFIAEPERSAEK